MAIENIDSIIVGIGAFLLSFIVLYLIWGIMLRIMDSVFSRSKFYFIPRLLKELGRSVIFLILLISAYLGVYFYQPGLLDATVVKVWGTLLILVMTEIIVRILLSAMDIYKTRLRGAPSFFSNRIPLLKTIIALFIYGIAALIVVSYLSYEIGSIVTLIGIVVLVLVFIIYFDLVRNIATGFQLAERMQEGDYIEMDGKRGFVEKIVDQYTIIRDIDGKSITIPNSRFVNGILKNNFFSEGNLISMKVKLKADGDKTKQTLAGVCGKVALKLEEVFNDYNPKVSLSGIEDGANVYYVKYIIAPNSDLRKIMDEFNSAIKKEFKNNVIEIKID